MAKPCYLDIEPMKPIVNGIDNSDVHDILFRPLYAGGDCPPPKGSGLSNNFPDSYSCFYKIKLGEEEIGKFGLTWYMDINSVGLGSLELYTEYRNRGYGECVLDSVISCLRDRVDMVYCYVEPTNLPAIHLYNKIGKVCFDRRDENGLIFVELYRKEMK